MFPNYRPNSRHTEKHELQRAETALKQALRMGIPDDFAYDLIDRGEIDFLYASAEQGADMIVRAYRAQEN